MVSFKDKVQAQAQPQPSCEPGPNQISYKDKLPPGEAPPGTPPSSPPPPEIQDICTCLGDKLDQIDIDIQSTYDSGPSFNTGKLFSSVATPVEIDEGITAFNPNVQGFYDEILVAPKRGGINAPRIWVIADPDKPFDPNDPFIYVRFSTGGSSTFSPETPVRVGEDWGFRNVFSFRIRTPFADQQYRITTDPHRTSFVSTVVNIPPGAPGATSAPVANRPNFLTDNINIPLANTDKQLPNIAIPNGFALVIRSNPFNAGNSRIWVSNNNAMFSTQRNTLAAGDSVKLYITNTDLVHVASNLANQTVDIIVEQ